MTFINGPLDAFFWGIGVGACIGLLTLVIGKTIEWIISEGRRR